MRTSLQIKQNLILQSTVDSSKTRKLTIESILGEGSCALTYKVKDADNGLIYILKECAPLACTERDSGGIIWKNEETRNQYLTRFENAFRTNREIQNRDGANMAGAHVVDEIYSGSNTLYALIDFNAGKTLDRYSFSTLQDIAYKIRAAANNIRKFHEAGYLYLDAKPQNIMAFDDSSDYVLLLDFDSAVKKESLSESDWLSYSPDFCAPEQCTGKAGRVCEATDVYGVGAMLFYFIFGRTPDALDRATGCFWEFKDNKYFSKLSGKCRRLTTEILHHSLNVSPKRRYRSMSEMIEALDDLIKESEPGKRHLVNTLPRAINTFVGRQKEILAIGTVLASSDSNIVVLHGIGGIGKTELAINYANICRNSYDAVCFGRYNGSLAELFEESSFISIANDNEADLSMKGIRDILDANVLLVIDNMSAVDDPDFELLLSLKCKIIITSRSDFEEAYPSVKQIEVRELRRKEQEQLFCTETNVGGSNSEIKAIRKILDCIDGYTLLIPLIAKQYRRGFLSLEEIADQISESGVLSTQDVIISHSKDCLLRDSTSNILKAVLDMSAMTEMENYVLSSLAMLKSITVERKTFLEWLGKQYNNALNTLIDSSWVQTSGSHGPHEQILVHDVIRQVYCDKYKPCLSDFSWVDSLAEGYIQEINKYVESPACQKFDFKDDTVSPYFVWDIPPEAGSKFQLKARLIERVLSNTDRSSEKDITFVIRTLSKICFNEISRAILFTDNPLELLYSVADIDAFKNLDLQTTLDYFYLVFLFRLSCLVKIRNDNDEVTESQMMECVSSLIKAADRYEQYIRKLFFDSSINEEKYNSEYYRFFAAEFCCVISYGRALYDCGWSSVNNEAGDVHLSHFYGVMDRLPKEVRTNPFIESNTCYLKSVASIKPPIPVSVRTDYSAGAIHYHIEDLESIEKSYKYSTIQNPLIREYLIATAKIADKHDHIYSLLLCCESMGYADYTNPTEQMKKTALNPMNWLEAERIFRRIDQISLEKKVLQESLIPPDEYYNNDVAVPASFFERLDVSYNIDRCVLCCCEGNAEKANEYFDALLDCDISYAGKVPDLYSILCFYGFPDTARHIVLQTISKTMEFINSSTEDDEKVELYDALQRCCTAIGDTTSALVYEKKRQELLNLGFIIT